MFSLTAAQPPTLGTSAKIASLPCCGESEIESGRGTAIPYYLTEHYRLAYVHPTAVKFFERQWLINLILWGNYARLRDAAVAELGEALAGRTLQVACVYGD